MMIQIMHNEIWRDGQKIGYFEGDQLRDRLGNIRGTFSESVIRDAHGNKAATIEGDYLYLADGTKTHLEDLSASITGMVSNAQRAAIRLLLGE